MSELMYQVQAQTNGWLSPDMPPIDAVEATQANLDAFSKAVVSLVQRSSAAARSEEHTSELQSHVNLVCRLLLEKKKKKQKKHQCLNESRPPRVDSSAWILNPDATRHVHRHY